MIRGELSYSQNTRIINFLTKALFTRREGYPSKRVNSSWRAKDSPGLQAKFHRQGSPTTRDNLMRGYTQKVWKL